jgi:hypothetical protein
LTEQPSPRQTPLEALASEIGGHTAKIEKGLMSLIAMLETRVAELEARIATLENR